VACFVGFEYRCPAEWCAGLLAITAEADNLWFLSLLTAREDIRRLA
jgi:hypothetical protein